MDGVALGFSPLAGIKFVESFLPNNIENFPNRMFQSPCGD